MPFWCVCPYPEQHMRFRSGWHGCSSVLSDKLLERPYAWTPVGARAADGRMGGPLGSPASSSSGFQNTTPPHPAGDPKGPPNPSSSALAPTEHLARQMTIMDGIQLSMYRH